MEQEHIKLDTIAHATAGTVVVSQEAALYVYTPQDLIPEPYTNTFGRISKDR